MVKDADIVGEALAKVLPAYDRPWFGIPHLLKLNLILLVSLLSCISFSVTVVPKEQEGEGEGRSGKG